MDSLIVKLTGSASSIMCASENHLLKDWNYWGYRKTDFSITDRRPALPGFNKSSVPLKF